MPIYESHKNSKLFGHITYAEDIDQTSKGSLISVSPNESQSVESVSCVLMVFLRPLWFLYPSSPSSAGLPELVLMFGWGLCIYSHQMQG